MTMKNLVTKNKMNIAFGLLCCFMLLPGIMEFALFSYQFPNDFDIQVFLISQILAIATAFYLLKSFDHAIISKKREVFVYKNMQVYTLFVVSIFLCMFLIFFIKNIGNFVELYLFMEFYRNGGFKGSAIYTFGITRVSMLLLTYIIATSRKISSWFYFSLIIVLTIVFLLGLRIFLLGIFLYSVIRIVERYNLFKVFGFLGIIFAFMTSFKLYLAMNIAGKSFLEVIQGIMGRLHLRALLNDSEFSMPLQEFGCLAPWAQYLSECELSAFKEWFVSMSPDVAIHMSFITLYSGVALSWPILMYNLFGIFGFIFVTPFIVLFILAIKKSFSQKSIYWGIVYTAIAISLFGFLVEDVGFLTNFLNTFVALIAVLIIIKLGLFMGLISKIGEGAHANY